MVALYVLFTTALCCCSSSNNDENDDGNPSEFIVTFSELTLTRDAQTLNFAVKCSMKWNVTCDASWITLSAGTYGIGDVDKAVKINVAATANDSYDERTADIIVTAGSQSKTVKVVQSNKDGLILDGASTLAAADTGDTLTVKFKSTGNVTMTCNDTWIHLLSTRTLTDRSAIFVVDKNTTSTGRNGTVDFVLNDLKQTLTISQPAMNLTVNDSIAPNSEGMNSDACALIKKIYAGWNLGNTLEATGNSYYTNNVRNTNIEDNDGLSTEMSWGAPKTTNEIIKFVKQCGFNAVRIPVAWTNHIVDANTHKIDPAWLERVKEIVGYVADNDMYALVNIHWDGGWLENQVAKGYSSSVDAEQAQLWHQIAAYLRDFDEHLIFAGCNEPNAKDANTEAALLKYEQTFINAVRSTGGRNAYRVLVIQGPCTDIDLTSQLLNTMPKDRIGNRLAVEVHYYNPWSFCGGDDASNPSKWYWGSYMKNGDSHNASGGALNESQVSSLMDKLKTKIADKQGIPMILGEYSVGHHQADDQSRSDASVAEWLYAVTKQAKNHGMATFVWDPQSNYSILDRNTRTVRYSQFLDGIMKGAKEGTYPF